MPSQLFFPKPRRACLAATFLAGLVPFYRIGSGPYWLFLFGVGAVLLARNPEGVITMNGRQLTNLGRRYRRVWAR